MLNPLGIIVWTERERNVLAQPIFAEHNFEEISPLGIVAGFEIKGEGDIGFDGSDIERLGRWRYGRNQGRWS